MKYNTETQYNNFSEHYSTQKDSQDIVSNDIFYKLIGTHSRGGKILDVGCGDGTDLQKLSGTHTQTFGIDPSSEFIEAAKQNNPTGIFSVGIGETIPCEDAMFDIVVSKWALQTSHNVPKCLTEISRVLKPGGVFVLLTKHPLQQFLEKERDGAGAPVDYYKQDLVHSFIYNGSIELIEPSHTIDEYLNVNFLTDFEILDFIEGSTFPASEQMRGNMYPTFFALAARKK